MMSERHIKRSPVFDMKLFKYVASWRVGGIESGMIRFTQASDFSDPFDLSPTYDMVSSEDQKRFSAEDDHEIKGSWSTTGERIRRVFSATAKGLEYLQRKFSLMEGSYSIDNNEQARMQLALTFGVLSLSEVHDHLLMWSHYADQHRGFVIEFDSENRFFAPVYGHSQPGLLARVDYSDTRPHLSHSTLNRPESLLRTATIWSYEREWRMIKYLEQADKHIPRENELPVSLFAFPPEAIMAIYTGAKMLPDSYTKLTSIISSDARYKHVRMHHMQLSANEYRLITTPPLPGTQVDPEHLPQAVNARPFRV
jgi:Protein of unknown function (DUF2971)